MKIYHLRDASRHPYATVAIDDDRVGVAICHPKDQFNKARGREIAIGRLKMGGRPKPVNRRVIVRNSKEDPSFAVGINNIISTLLDF